MMGAGSWAVLGTLGQIAEGADDAISIDMGEAEGADAGGIDDPAATGKGEGNHAG